MYYTSIAEIKGFRFKSRAGLRRNPQRSWQSVPFAGTRHHLDVEPALAPGISLTCAAPITACGLQLDKWCSRPDPEWLFLGRCSGQ
ncbi:MAG: hypothetical protein WA137_10555 [Methanothrix sp.]